MKKILFLLFVLISPTLLAQHVSTIDFMKTVDDNREELIYYYEHNWKVLRDIALERGFIHSYELMITDPESETEFDVILITRYSNREQYEKAEDRFQEIIAERDGLKLLNELKPDEFRKRVFNANSESLFSSFYQD